MVHTLAQVEHFAAMTPHPHDGGTWNQRCEQFVNNAGDFGLPGYPTALMAADASGHLDTNHLTARPGELHYWAGGVNNAGHVAFQTSRGLLMASNSIAYPYTGYISWNAFAAAKPEFKYLGHTYRHGTKRLAGLVLESAGTVVVLKAPTIPKEEDMTRYYVPEVKATKGVKHVPRHDYLVNWGAKELIDLTGKFNDVNVPLARSYDANNAGKPRKVSQAYIDHTVPALLA
jgi:hypothetical protein